MTSLRPEKALQVGIDGLGFLARQRELARRQAECADAIDEFVQTDASDGFVLVPHITPGGLDEFADTVVPLLQERGVFRTDYDGTTLRDHLGLDKSTRVEARATDRAAS